jgi:alkanesulfonate monooxygenase SsuD/methylene tetrahydromethanopterin reductase-like flavin-dependent oxidoreductase (luciferase family)
LTLIDLSGNMPVFLERRKGMGSKSQPGFYSYLGKAEPDEPVFVLMGRDPLAPDLIRRWADTAQANGERRDKVAEAYALAKQFEEYAHDFKNRPTNVIIAPDSE